MSISLNQHRQWPFHTQHHTFSSHTHTLSFFHYPFPTLDPLLSCKAQSDQEIKYPNYNLISSTFNRLYFTLSFCCHFSLPFFACRRLLCALYLIGGGGDHFKAAHPPLLLSPLCLFFIFSRKYTRQNTVSPFVRSTLLFPALPFTTVY